MSEDNVVTCSKIAISGYQVGFAGGVLRVVDTQGATCDFDKVIPEFSLVSASHTLVVICGSSIKPIPATPGFSGRVSLPVADASEAQALCNYLAFHGFVIHGERFRKTV